MAKPKALVEAEARLAELRAIEDAWEAHKAERESAMEPNRARRAALEKRHKQRTLLTKAGGQPNSTGGGISLTSLYAIGPGYGFAGYGETKLPKPGDLAKRILSGEQRVTVSTTGYGGTAYTLRGLLDRTVAIDKPRLRGVVKAQAARRRAEKRLEDAWRAEREAFAAAYAAGDKLDREAVAKEVARRVTIPTQAQFDEELRPNHNVDWLIQEAEQHLAWVKAKNPDKDVCPCGSCQRERRDKADAAKEAKRIAALPTVMFTCPEDQKRHRGSVDVVEYREHQISDSLRELLDDRAPGWQALGEKGDYGYTYFAFERIHCPVHGQWHAFLTAIAKRAAAAAKAATKRERGAKVEWTCPNPECSEPVITAKPHDGDEVIECPVCGIEAVIASLAIRRYVGKAPVTEAEQEEAA